MTKEMVLLRCPKCGYEITVIKGAVVISHPCIPGKRPGVMQEVDSTQKAVHGQLSLF